MFSPTASAMRQTSARGSWTDFFRSFFAPFQLFSKVDFYGVGLGMGTNVGAGLLFEGQRKFLSPRAKWAG